MNPLHDFNDIALVSINVTFVLARTNSTGDVVKFWVKLLELVKIPVLDRSVEGNLAEMDRLSATFYQGLHQGFGQVLRLVAEVQLADGVKVQLLETTEIAHGRGST